MKKYIFLYNLLYEDDGYERRTLNQLKKVIPDLEIKPISIINGEITEGKSIWIPEDKYLMAWTIWNYEELLGISFLDEDNDNEIVTTLDDGIEWYNLHKNNELYVWDTDRLKE